jgi:hypothetical protein
MKIYCQNPINFSCYYQVRHQLGSNWRTPFTFAVLAGVTKIRQYRRDSTGRGASQAIDENQQLHKVMIDRMARRLNQKTVSTANIIFYSHKSLAVGKPVH